MSANSSIHNSSNIPLNHTNPMTSESQPSGAPQKIPNPDTIAKTDNLLNPGRTSRPVTPVRREDAFPPRSHIEVIPFEQDEDEDFPSTPVGHNTRGSTSSSRSAPLTDEDNITFDALDDLNLEVEFEKIDGPEDVLASLKKLNNQLTVLTDETKKVFTDGVAEAKKLRTRGVTHLPPDKLNAMAGDLKEYWGRAENRTQYFQKCLGRLNECENVPPDLQKKIQDQVDEISNKLPILDAHIKNDLKTYRMSRLAKMIALIAKMLGSLNENMEFIRSIR